eukprot:s2202_g18.t1
MVKSLLCLLCTAFSLPCSLLVPAFLKTVAKLAATVLLEAAGGSLFSKVACALQLAATCVLGTFAHFAAQEHAEELKRRRNEVYADFLFAGAHTEEALVLEERLGGGLYGEVYVSRRYGKVLAAKVPRQGGPVPPEPVLHAEFRRACCLSHDNLVMAFEKLGSATIWRFVQGSAWQTAIPQLSFSQLSQVPSQVASVSTYLVRANHVIWDLHSQDVVLESRPDGRVHMTLLDIFMPPCQSLVGAKPRGNMREMASQEAFTRLCCASRNSGCVGTLPPELKCRGPQRMHHGPLAMTDHSLPFFFWKRLLLETSSEADAVMAQKEVMERLVAMSMPPALPPPPAPPA